MELGIRGKNALVCAASKGLGRACAGVLAREGCHVTIIARTREALEQPAAEIRQATGRPIAQFITDFPIPEPARRQLVELYTTPRVALERFADAAAREAYLARTSYTRFLREDWGLAEDAIAYFAARPLDFFGLPPNLIPALDASLFGYPGFAGIPLPQSPPMDEMTEPYVYHFPHGNASIARLLVRSLVPSALPGATMEDVVLARARYEQLDQPAHKVRIRLDSTVVRVLNDAAGVEVGYLDNRDRSLHRLRARHVVLACFNSLIPYALPGFRTRRRRPCART